jgi:hypothetical protein
VEGSRDYCRTLGDLRVELASTTESDRFRARSRGLQSEVNELVASGARVEADSQAGVLAGLMGLSLEHVETSVVVLFAVLVEFGAAFGLFLAMLPLRGIQRRARETKPPEMGAKTEARLHRGGQNLAARAYPPTGRSLSASVADTGRVMLLQPKSKRGRRVWFEPPPVSWQSNESFRVTG